MKRSALRIALVMTIAAPLWVSSSWADDTHHPAQTQPPPAAPQAQMQPGQGGMMMNCPMMQGGQAAEGGTMNCPMMQANSSMTPGQTQGMGPGMMHGIGTGQTQPGPMQHPPTGNQ